jgi:drug/metabolite transporter (DMT)-like permease
MSAQAYVLACDTDSLLYLPLADATVITFLAPSLACWACSYLINEPFTRMEQIAAYISLAGVVLIARPTSLFASFGSDSPPASGDGDLQLQPNSTLAEPNMRDYEHVTPAQRAGAVGIGLLGVLGSACAFTTIRWIGKRAHPLISVNYFAVWCTIVSTVMMIALPGVGFLLPSGWKEWGYLIFLGICGFVMVSFPPPPLPSRQEAPILTSVRLAISPCRRIAVRKVVPSHQHDIHADALRADV